MEVKHNFGDNTSILQKDVDNQTEYIINYLKTKKQTYSINKFVLEETICKLGNQII